MSLAELAPESPAVAATRPLRVCHVSLTLKTGGLERLLADIARRHNPRGCQPEFLAMNEVGRFADQIRESGCPVHRLRPASRPGQIWQMVQLFRRNHYDVIHTHNTYPHLYATIAARLARVPVVLNTRHGQRAGHHWKSSLLFRWASLLADKVVAVSDDAARLCIAVDGVARQRVTRVWNGIDVDDFQFHGPVPEPVAISVARLSPEKDFPTLLEAIALAAKSVPNLRLKLVGDGPERAKLEEQSRALGLTGRVEFLGDCSNVPELLGQAGFFVSASLTEGISLTLLEAMAVGLPVIATSVGGNPEIVEVARTGSLVPPANPQALADAIVAMCQQPQRWSELGQAGRQRVEQHFDVGRMVSDYEQLYRELIADRV